MTTMLVKKAPPTRVTAERTAPVEKKAPAPAARPALKKTAEPAAKKAAEPAAKKAAEPAVKKAAAPRKTGERARKAAARNSAADMRRAFIALKSILEAYESKMVVHKNDTRMYYLNTNHIMKNKQPMFFGAVAIMKSYVSFHLMPVYAFPDLLAGMSPGLAAHMQGKSCFNFKTVEPAIFRELQALTRSGFERYRREKIV